MQPTHCSVYEFFCLKIKTKNRADLYMPCEAMAHSTKWYIRFHFIFVIANRVFVVGNVNCEKNSQPQYTVAQLQSVYPNWGSRFKFGYADL